MEVEGRVEAVSYKNKGIKVNGRWYNVPEDMLKQIQKNHRVKLFIDDFGNVLEVEVLGYEEQIDKDLKIEALRASIEILKLNFQFGHHRFTHFEYPVWVWFFNTRRSHIRIIQPRGHYNRTFVYTEPRVTENAYP
jgi:hypothetical protein